MHSRAYLLLKRDLANLQRFPMDGVSAAPNSELNMFQWQARLQGLPDTPWEGGVFQLHLQFSADFNTAPPTVQFMTIPFHPNIDPADGTPHCHLLSGGGWSEAISVPILLIALQALLSSPELDTGHVVNAEACQLLERAPHAYHQMAMDCVTASLRVNAGLAPYEENEDSKSPPISPPPPVSPSPLPPLQPQSVSFDEYFSLWRHIATSKHPTTHYNVQGASDQRFRESRARNTDLQHKLHQHHVLQYGTGGNVGPQLSRSLVRRHKMEQLRLKYTERGEEEVRGEVDQLLTWTKSLDGTALSTPQSLTTPV